MPVVGSASPLDTAPDLARGRDPKASKKKADAQEIGSIAFNDAVLIVIGAWVVVLFLHWSLRGHTV